MIVNVVDLLNAYLDSDDTCDEVIARFKDENAPKPIGGYYPLAKYFIDENYSESITYTDKCYKKWLRDLIDNDMESESIALSVLKKKYPTRELLDNYVFRLNGIAPELNQKWHFFISYWGYRDYVTKNPNVYRGKIVTLKNGTEAESKNPFKKCIEGQLWYAHVSKYIK